MTCSRRFVAIKIMIYKHAKIFQSAVEIFNYRISYFRLCKTKIISLLHGYGREMGVPIHFPQHPYIFIG